MPLSPDEKARLQELRTKIDELKVRKLADPSGEDAGRPTTAAYRVAQAEARLARARRRVDAVRGRER